MSLAEQHRIATSTDRGDQPAAAPARQYSSPADLVTLAADLG
ncbi:hypothetical protein [Embleya scabrispora]|nr:hypothetical protein [Embleya scabrispora]